MTVMEAIESRRSIRQYLDRPVEKDTMSNGHAVDTTDVCIALTMAMLEAWELGLGTCLMASYTEPVMREALGLSETTSIVAIMPIGYAAENLPAKPCKPVEEIAVYI